MANSFADFSFPFPLCLCLCLCLFTQKALVGPRFMLCHPLTHSPIHQLTNIHTTQPTQPHHHLPQTSENFAQIC
ncbi:hypothetical protein B0T21DRAFT_376062 [Apiosordaria backusii]|uniref:Secreted protein n=1 Tax=Apiosordaria backusii TaxID=314023 RepID=A0AA40AA91_9PEZI|nr:hypothetical protein B0T21DRAFT_376062 [Apiosordaria backusii]